MVFGNMGRDCSTGVAFTRNPSTGEKSFFGEFLINAQGEDVVAGTRTPQHITKKQKKCWFQRTIDGRSYAKGLQTARSSFYKIRKIL